MAAHELPFCAAQVDPASGAHVRAYFFLGAVPAAVLAAARRAKPKGADPRRVDWSAADAAVLRRHYGAGWRAALTASDPPRVRSHRGGEPPEFDFSDLAALDDLDDAVAPAAAAEPDGAPGSAAAPPVFTDIAVYPEDTLFDLRLKLQVATGAPFYRAHLFFYVGGDGPQLPYRVTIDGAPVAVDWRALAPATSRAVARVAVDPRALERREGVVVISEDRARTLTSAGRIDRAYFVDLFAVIPPLTAVERPNDGLAAVLRDSYQFDLLWHGALAMYWPQLGPAACLAALSGADVAEGFPAIAPSTAALAARFAAERRAAEAAHVWRPAAAKGARPTTAVTAATVEVRTRAAVDVRNVFDAVPTSPALPAAAVFFEVDATDVALPPGARQAGAVPVVATRRHASSYIAAAPAVEAFLARAPREPAVAYAVARPARNSVATLTVGAAGGYRVAAEWREDERAGFEDVAREIAELSDPVVAAVAGAARVELPKVSGGGYRVGPLTVSTFWPHALTTDSFRQLKDRFRSYEQAGIVSIRGLQQGSAYAFAFRKGVISDPDENGYAWLAALDGAPGGCPVRIHHRATDLRIELEARDRAEFELVRSYLLSFLDSLLEGPGRLRLATGAPEPEADGPLSTAASRRLRRLQERDPMLFDLKRHDPDATVYSVLCQSERQPHIYSAAEAAALGARRRGALTRYWNFTEKAPAYYACPSAKYPHLSFRAGAHPLGFCLPCCKKTLPVPDSRAAQANAACAATRDGKTPLAGDDDDAPSRHVLAYGKAVPPGRASEVAPELAAGLFLEAVPAPYGLYMVGIEQAAPAVPDAGFAYALAHALALRATSSPLAEMAAAVAGMPDTYFRLGGGAAGAFASAADLADAIVGAFVTRDEALSPFGPGGAAADSWPDILADLAAVVFGVTVVRIVAEAPKLMLTASPGAAATLALQSTLVALVAVGPGGVYPVSALDPRLYLRTPAEDRWMAERRLFAFEYDTADGVVADAVAERVAAALAVAAPAPASVAAAGYSVAQRLVDLHDRCYGYILRDAAGDAVFAPVPRSAYPADGTLTVAGARPAVPLPRRALLAYLAATGRGDAAPEFSLRRAGLAVGFVLGGLYYHHDPEPAEGAGAPAIEMPYDSRLVDEAIVAARGARPVAATAELAARAQRRNQLYRLFVAEFAGVLQLDRNEKLRKELYAAVEKCRFDDAGSLAELRAWLSRALKDYPADLAVVRAIIQEAYSDRKIRDIGSATVASLRATRFGFDRATLRELRALPTHADVVRECRRVLADHVEVGDDSGVGPVNVYAACSEQKRLRDAADAPQCRRGKLLVPADRIDDFYDILAADVRNPYRETALVAAGSFDPLNFVRRVGETLTVEMRLDNLRTHIDA
jgi:hypothetical protein